MFGMKKKPNSNEGKPYFIKLDGIEYTEADIENMDLPEIDRLLIKVDVAIEDCALYLERMKEEGTYQDEKAKKTNFALSRLKRGKTLVTAIKRSKMGEVKENLEKCFMRIAKRELTENQYNRILVKAQAEYELQG